jgi:hypothetical protein
VFPRGRGGVGVSEGPSITGPPESASLSRTFRRADQTSDNRAALAARCTIRGQFCADPNRQCLSGGQATRNGAKEMGRIGNGGEIGGGPVFAPVEGVAKCRGQTGRRPTRKRCRVARKTRGRGLDHAACRFYNFHPIGKLPPLSALVGARCEAGAGRRTGANAADRAGEAGPPSDAGEAPDPAPTHAGPTGHPPPREGRGPGRSPPRSGTTPAEPPPVPPTPGPRR